MDRKTPYKCKCDFYNNILRWDCTATDRDELLENIKALVGKNGDVTLEDTLLLISWSNIITKESGVTLVENGDYVGVSDCEEVFVLKAREFYELYFFDCFVDNGRCADYVAFTVTFILIVCILLVFYPMILCGSELPILFRTW